jgi:hypothetical protein
MNLLSVVLPFLADSILKIPTPDVLIIFIEGPSFWQLPERGAKRMVTGKALQGVCSILRNI